MSTLTTAPAADAAQPAQSAATGRWSSVLAYQIYCELIRLLRMPAFTIPTFLFPIMFFAFFGLSYAGQEIPGTSTRLGAYLMASYGAYAVMSVALFSFGASIAAERGLGWTRLPRVTPLRSSSLFVAKAVMAVIFGVLVLLALFAFGALAGGVRMPLLTWAKLLALLVGGMLPFVALGLFIGYIAGPTSAAPIANLVFLPLSFASGLFIPLANLPRVARDAAPYLPTYHLGQLGWTLLGAGDGRPLSTHLLWLAGYTILFLALATLAYRRDEGKNYG